MSEAKGDSGEGIESRKPSWLLTETVLRQHRTRMQTNKRTTWSPDNYDNNDEGSRIRTRTISDVNNGSNTGLKLVDRKIGNWSEWKFSST